MLQIILQPYRSLIGRSREKREPLMIMMNEVLQKPGTKGAAHCEYKNGFQKTGFSGAVFANNKINALRW
ncbi:MAG: hypothetical protein Kow0083_05700 [Methylophaga sp.]